MSDSNEIKMRLVIIRHGITQGNIEKRYVGQTDMSLCSEGVKQIKDNAESGMYPEVDMLFISPLKRCRETASIIYPYMEPIVIENLKEMDFGDFEGKNYNDLNDNPVYQAFIDSNGELAFPNGEDKQSFAKRISSALNEVAQTAAANNARKVACVAHGGTTMAACSVLGLAEYFDSIVGNGGKLEIDITYDISHNSITGGVLA